jgi:hypothetical protein
LILKRKDSVAAAHVFPAGVVAGGSPAKSRRLAQDQTAITDQL